jgi:hypothetical protein
VRVDSSGSEPAIYTHRTPLIEFTDSVMVWGVGPNVREALPMELARGIFWRRDNGARVTESEFIETMARIVHRTSKTSK